MLDDVPVQPRRVVTDPNQNKNVNGCIGSKTMSYVDRIFRHVLEHRLEGIRVNSASGQVGPGQLGRVNSAGSSRPYIKSYG